MSKKILLVEDEEMLSLIVKETLELKKYQVEIAADGKEAIKKFDELKPDLVVLDIMIPNLSGYEVAQYIRKKNQKVPIIFLSAKSQTEDVLKGFDAGANDYMKKPFSIEELLARIAVLIRVTSGESAEKTVFQLGQYRFDFSSQQLVCGENKVTISYRESQVLKYLAESKNEVVEKNIILKDLWGDNSVSNSRNLDVVITKLRQYLKDDDAVRILNSRGVGYKLLTE